MAVRQGFVPGETSRQASVTVPEALPNHQLSEVKLAVRQGFETLEADLVTD